MEKKRQEVAHQPWRSIRTSPRVLPAQYVDFFDRISLLGLGPQQFMQRLNESNDTSLFKLIQEVKDIFPLGAIGATQAVPTFADTLASASLSGTSYPCPSVGCRAKHAEHGARFAALYSSHTFIRSPFEGIEHTKDHIRDFATASLAVLHAWRPLLLSGHASHLADICLACLRESVSEDKILTEPVQKLGFAMEEHLLNKTIGTIIRKDGKIIIEIHMPPQYTGHAAMSLEPRGKAKSRARKLLGRSKKSRILDPQELRAFRVHDPLIGRALNEVMVQAYHRKSVNGYYASDLPIDIELAARAATPTAVPTRPLLRALSHTLPVIMNIPLESVISLRKEEPDAFNLYRDRISRIASLDETSKEFSKEAYELQREFSQLQQHIKTKKRSVLGRTASQVVIATGTVGVGLAAAFFGIIPLELGIIGGAAGGVPAAHKLVETIGEVKRSQNDAVENPLYFLWRISKSK